MFSDEDYYWLDVLTVTDMLNFTPQGYIERCSYRDKTGNNIIKSDKNMCDIFEIKKYINQNYICFRLKTKEDYTIDLKSVVNSFYNRRMLYEVQFGGIYVNVTKIRTIITHKDLPYKSRTYSLRFIKKKSTGIYLQLSCQNVTDTWLGYPYFNFICHTKHDMLWDDCVYYCMQKKSLKNFNRLPFDAFHGVPIDKKILSPTLMNMYNVSETWSLWRNQCASSCKIRKCHYSYCITTGHAYAMISDEGIEDHSSAIRVESASGPDISVHYYPQMYLLDFIIYIFSSMGTWFGLVIISCNPVTAFTHIAEKMKRRLNRRRDRKDIVLRRMHMRTKLDDPRFKIYHRIAVGM